MGDLRHGFHIDEVAVGVPHGFHIERFGVGTDGLFKVFGVAAVHKGGFNAVFRQRVGEVVISAAVDRRRGNDVVTV